MTCSFKSATWRSFFYTVSFTVCKYIIIYDWSAVSHDWLVFHKLLWPMCLHLFSLFAPHSTRKCFSSSRLKGHFRIWENVLVRDGWSTCQCVMAVKPVSLAWTENRALTTCVQRKQNLPTSSSNSPINTSLCLSCFITSKNKQ